ncbi:hypothetical protein D3C85_1025340 [compost metagenome]
MAAAPLLHVDPAHEVDARVDAFQRAHEFVVARIAGKGQVEGLVELQQARGVAVFRLVAGALHECPQAGKLFVGCALARGTHDAGFQHRAVLVQAVDLLGVQQAGDEAPIYRAGQKALDHELIEHFAQRCAADIQPARQLDLVDAFARLELEAHGHGLDGAVQLGLPGRRAGNGSDCSLRERHTGSPVAIFQSG